MSRDVKKGARSGEKQDPTISTRNEEGVNKKQIKPRKREAH